MSEYRIAESVAGKDKGGVFAVMEQKDNTVLICDGKRRPIERPKKKNARHIMLTDDSLQIEGITNKALRRALKEYVGSQRSHKS